MLSGKAASCIGLLACLPIKWKMEGVDRCYKCGREREEGVRARVVCKEVRYWDERK